MYNMIGIKSYKLYEQTTISHQFGTNAINRVDLEDDINVFRTGNDILWCCTSKVVIWCEIVEIWNSNKLLSGETINLAIVTTSENTNTRLLFQILDDELSK